MSWTDRGLFVQPGKREAAFRLTRRIHFVAIGGVGMSGIAEVLLHLVFEVSGSDMKESSLSLRLSELGATVHVGHAGDHVGQADVVVYSSAVPDTNPELLEAHNNLAALLQRDGAVEKALSHYRSAFRIAPDSADVSYNLALLLERLGRLDEAAAYYRRCLELAPEARHARSGLERTLAAMRARP